MTYAVVVTPEAQANIAEAFGYIAERDPTAATRWLQGMNLAIGGLEAMPRRCGSAREQAHFTEEIRQLVYGSYRIIFTIDDVAQIVSVVHVRHGRQRTVGESVDAPDE